MIKNGTYHASVSKSEILFFNIIESILHRKIKRQFHLDGKIFDGCIGNLLIECDSDYWHQNAVENDSLKNKIATNNDFKLLRARINNVSEAQEKASYYSDIIEFVT
jgi:very-short-patch-repair endonuclease